MGYECWLCARGLKEPVAEDEQTYTPKPPGANLKIVLRRAHRRKHRVQLADVSRAFLHAPVKSEVVVKPPKEWKDCVTVDGLDPVEDEGWLLTKATYGLQTWPAQWDDHFAEALTSLPSSS